MSARDRFTANLRCPKCGRTGIAKLSELDGYSYARGDQSTKVDLLPEGFKIVDRKSGLASVDLFCVKCDVSAITKGNEPNV
jgi:hypothetical protein